MQLTRHCFFDFIHTQIIIGSYLLNYLIMFLIPCGVIFEIRFPILILNFVPKELTVQISKVNNLWLIFEFPIKMLVTNLVRLFKIVVYFNLIDLNDFSLTNSIIHSLSLFAYLFDSPNLNIFDRALPGLLCLSHLVYLLYFKNLNTLIRVLSHVMNILHHAS